MTQDFIFHAVLHEIFLHDVELNREQETNLAHLLPHIFCCFAVGFPEYICSLIYFMCEKTPCPFSSSLGWVMENQGPWRNLWKRQATVSSCGLITITTWPFGFHAIWVCGVLTPFEFLVRTMEKSNFICITRQSLIFWHKAGASQFHKCKTGTTMELKKGVAFYCLRGFSLSMVKKIEKSVIRTDTNTRSVLEQ